MSSKVVCLMMMYLCYFILIGIYRLTRNSQFWHLGWKPPVSDRQPNSSSFSSNSTGKDVPINGADDEHSDIDTPVDMIGTNLLEFVVIQSLDALPPRRIAQLASNFYVFANNISIRYYFGS